MAEPSSRGCRSPKPSGLRRDNIQPQKHPCSRAGLGYIPPTAAVTAVQPCAHHVFTHPHEQPVLLLHSTRAPSQLGTGAPRATGASPGWRQPHPTSSLPSAGFCGKPELFPTAGPSESAASLGMLSHCFHAVPLHGCARRSTASSEQGKTQIYGVQGPGGTSAEHRWPHPCLSREPPQPWGSSDSRRARPCAALTLLSHTGAGQRPPKSCGRRCSE